MNTTTRSTTLEDRAQEKHEAELELLRQQAASHEAQADLLRAQAAAVRRESGGA